VLNRPPPSYDGHVPLTRIERGALAVGSVLGAVVDPRRAGTFLQASIPYTIADFELTDLVAALGEVTAGPFIEYLRDTMLL
jgi:ubiquinone biosynthesis protein COQ4